jgi:hypothetical protein
VRDLSQNEPYCFFAIMYLSTIVESIIPFLFFPSALSYMEAEVSCFSS